MTAARPSSGKISADLATQKSSAPGKRRAETYPRKASPDVAKIRAAEIKRRFNESPGRGARYVLDAIRPSVQRGNVQACNILLQSVADMYAVYVVLRGLDDRSRPTTCRVMGLRWQEEKPALSLVKWFLPPPEELGPKRRRVQNTASRYASVLEAAYGRGLKPVQFVRKVQAAGGLDGYVGIDRREKDDLRVVPSGKPARHKRPKKAGSPVVGSTGSHRLHDNRLVQVKADKGPARDMLASKGVYLAVCDVNPKKKLIRIRIATKSMSSPRFWTKDILMHLADVAEYTSE